MRSTQHWKGFVTSIVVALTVLARVSPIAFAEEQQCQGTLGAVAVDNLRVPQNASCALDGTRVQGTITVERNATLYAWNVDVVGNIQAEDAARVEVLPGSTVGGSIQIVQSGTALVDSVQINGDLSFNANERVSIATGNRVGGNLQAFQNTGGLLIFGNTIDGNLQCKENRPPPSGGNNVVQGNKEDQCAHLEMQLKPRVFLPLVGLNA